MSKNYKEIIDELEASIERIESKGISIKPLNDSIEELKIHSDNIEKIEANIDAIREEVIDRIKKELDENKTAGKFSIAGFWLGIIALVVTTLSILIDIGADENQNINKDFSQFEHKNNLEKKPTEDISSRINIIDQKINKLYFSINGYDDKYQPDTSQLFVGQFLVKPVRILKSEESELAVKAGRVRESMVEGKYRPTVELEFYINGRKIGKKGLRDFIKPKTNNSSFRYDEIYKGMIFCEGDQFICFDQHVFEVLRIFRKDSKILKIADNKSGVLIGLNE